MTKAGLHCDAEATELSSLEIANLIQPENDPSPQSTDDKLALLRTLLVMAIAASVTILSYMLARLHG